MIDLNQRELSCLRAVLLHHRWKASVKHWALLETIGLVERTRDNRRYYGNREARGYVLLISEDECRALLAVEKLQEGTIEWTF